MEKIAIVPLTEDLFAPYGEVLETRGTPDKLINQGLCGRFHDLANIDVADGRVGISVFDAEARKLPMVLEMVERHPLGSQAFIPMSAKPFLVIVAPDNAGVPGRPHAFRTAPGQAVNYRRGTWHGVLTPLSTPGLFAVVDRIGDGANLEEHWFDAPYLVG